MVVATQTNKQTNYMTPSRELGSELGCGVATGWRSLVTRLYVYACVVLAGMARGVQLTPAAKLMMM